MFSVGQVLDDLRPLDQAGLVGPGSGKPLDFLAFLVGQFTQLDLGRHEESPEEFTPFYVRTLAG